MQTELIDYLESSELDSLESRTLGKWSRYSRIQKLYKWIFNILFFKQQGQEIKIYYLFQSHFFHVSERYKHTTQNSLKLTIYMMDKMYWLYIATKFNLEQINSFLKADANNYLGTWYV